MDGQHDYARVKQGLGYLIFASARPASERWPALSKAGGTAPDTELTLEADMSGSPRSSTNYKLAVIERNLCNCLRTSLECEAVL
jgi:hypothetical protein